jgi:integrase
MPKRSLTQLAVDRLGPPKKGSVDYWDSHLPAFGLRVTAAGHKSWTVIYRIKGDRRQHHPTLGTLSEIPNVAEARAAALAALEKARAGIDPGLGRKPAATIAAAVQQRLDHTTAESVAAIAGRFIREHAERHCRPLTIAEYRRVFNKEIIPHWGTRPLTGITKRDVNALLDKKAESYPRQADELRKHLRTFFRWTKDKELTAIDPTDGTRPLAKHESRDRVLSDSEIRLVWQGCNGLGWPFGRITQLLILTAQRRDEVGGMRWREIDLERRLWTIPKERAKNNKAHTVYLCSLAVAFLDDLPRLGDLVFTTTGATPPSGWSRAKARLDRLITGYAGGTPVEPWVLHDLRRSACSGMAELGVLPHIADKILNHASGTIRGVAAVYNKHQYGKERQAALELWGQHLEGLIAPQRLPLPAAAE